MPYVLRLRQGSDETFDRLVTLGALDIEHSSDGGLVALMPDGVSAAAAAGVDPADFTVSPAFGRDDGSVWTLGPRVVRVGRIVIVPSDTEFYPDAVRLLDTSAFGTGLHPTTALCLELLDHLIADDPPREMLDVGTGSGVLALAALTLGVARVTAIDIDEDAIRVASENAMLNGMTDRLALSLGGPESVAAAFPLVVANVLAAPLIELAPVLVRRVAHHGRLVVSGVPRSVEDGVVRAYRRVGMHHVSTIARSEWVALLLQASW